MILLIGGAGYIGSHMWKSLELSGREVCVIDNLSTGNLKAARGRKFEKVDLLDFDSLDCFFYSLRGKIDVVMHFAAKSLVGESVSDPYSYYDNNVTGTLNLLNAMRKHEVENIVFSSTAATFGEPLYTPIDETHPQNPINPYGSSKLMVERILKDFSFAYNLNSISLRYFNACGADPESEIGEMHEPETHLLPLILQAASGRRDSINVFGRDYDTDDGTCVRDYVHVLDLCQAHELAIDALKCGSKKGAHAFNLGNGEGFSVQNVIETAKNIVKEDGFSIDVVDKPRRTGDPARLVADASLVKKELGWQPRFPELEIIVRHAWAWEKKLAGFSK